LRFTGTFFIRRCGFLIFNICRACSCHPWRIQKVKVIARGEKGDGEFHDCLLCEIKYPVIVSRLWSEEVSIKFTIDKELAENKRLRRFLQKIYFCARGRTKNVKSLKEPNDFKIFLTK